MNDIYKINDTEYIIEINLNMKKSYAKDFLKIVGISSYYKFEFFLDRAVD